MNYREYSKGAFEKLNPIEARNLADKLQEDVLVELHAAVSNKFIEVVNKLNAEGHSLSPYTETIPGDIHYRDLSSLRLALDLIISAGYRDTVVTET